MMTYKIEKGVEIPRTAYQEYPFDEMEVGDSFFVEGGSTQISKGDSRAYRAAKMYGLRHSVEFSARTVEGGLRIWRVK